jgi:hypothetical protein
MSDDLGKIFYLFLQINIKFIKLFILKIRILNERNQRSILIRKN